MDKEKVLSEEELSDVSGGRILFNADESKKKTVVKGIKLAAKVATGLAAGNGLGNVLADTINSGSLGGGLGGGLGGLPGNGGDTNLQ